MRCSDACSRDCITLSQPGVRVLFGGKLGRHPRLAKVAGEMVELSEVIGLLNRVVGSYLDNAEPEERFADFLLRTRTLF